MQYELQTAWDVSTALAFDASTLKFLRIDDHFDADDYANGIYYKDDSTVFINNQCQLLIDYGNLRCQEKMIFLLLA